MRRPAPTRPWRHVCSAATCFPLPGPPRAFLLPPRPREPGPFWRFKGAARLPGPKSTGSGGGGSGGGRAGDAAPRRTGRAHPFPARHPRGLRHQCCDRPGRVSADPGGSSGAGTLQSGSGQGAGSCPPLVLDAGSSLGLEGGSIQSGRGQGSVQGAIPSGMSHWVPSGPREGGAVSRTGCWVPPGPGGSGTVQPGAGGSVLPRLSPQKGRCRLGLCRRGSWLPL